MQTQNYSREALLQRIDTIIREMMELREKVARMQSVTDTDEDLAQQLYGAVGHGTWDEYDMDLDWQRFEA